MPVLNLGPSMLYLANRVSEVVNHWGAIESGAAVPRRNGRVILYDTAITLALRVCPFATYLCLSPAHNIFMTVCCVRCSWRAVSLAKDLLHFYLSALSQPRRPVQLSYTIGPGLLWSSNFNTD
jgi:hypothetical protein